MQGPFSQLRVWCPLLVVAVVALLGFAGSAHAEIPHRTVYLYTIGPSGEFPSRFGHSLLCVRAAEKDTPEGGRCYDYGIADREDVPHIVWTSLRDIPSFVPVTVDETIVLNVFKDQGRQIERQRVPMTMEEVDRLVSAMDIEVREKQAYAYHPYRANCATKIRDHLDAATNGRLRKGPSSPPKGSFREYMEEGHSGRLGILTAMALYLGEANDRMPTPWEAMLLPSVLRDGVAERFQAPPEKLEERLAAIVPTSRAVGRMALFFLAFVLFVSVRIAARRGKMATGLKIVGGVLGALALTMELAAVMVKWPEVTQNWGLLLILPTDLLLPYLSGRRLVVYLKVRIGMAVLFAGLEIANVAHQPLLPLVALVAFPMLGVLSALKEKAREEEPEASNVPAASSRG